VTVDLLGWQMEREKELIKSLVYARVNPKFERYFYSRRCNFTGVFPLSSIKDW